jgi:hypothetical protein
VFIAKKYKDLAYVERVAVADELLEIAGVEHDVVRAYVAVLSGRLGKVFEEDGVVTRLIRQGEEFALVLIELLVQHRCVDSPRAIELRDSGWRFPAWKPC